MRQEHVADEVGEQNTLKGAESSDLLANFRINTVSWADRICLSVDLSFWWNLTQKTFFW